MVAIGREWDVEVCLFLGPRGDMDDVADAFEKVYEHREALRRSAAAIPAS